MKLYIELDGENIVGHNWLYLYPEIESDPKYIACKFSDPKQIFDIEKLCYKYKVVDGEYIELDEQGMIDHPLKRRERRIKKLERLKKREERKRHRQEWNAVKAELTDQEEIDEVNKILTDLDME